MTSYSNIARRRRPTKFSEVLGQEEAVEVLKNAVQEDRILQSYLLHGPRGCGKTTLSRILAMSANCENPDGVEPCGECQRCKEIKNGSQAGAVYEVDGASSRGIDSVRSLIAEAHTATSVKRKFIIIDEAHALTGDAQRALYKTVEEPPPNVTFILATTEIGGILAPLRSRSFSVPLRLFADDKLKEVVQNAAESEGFDITDEQVEAVVAAGNGSARDALTALENYETSADNPDECIDELIRAVAEQDASIALVAIHEAVQGGKQADSITAQMVVRLRELLLLMRAPQILKVSDTKYQKLYAQAKSIGLVRAVRMMAQFSELAGETKHTIDSRLLLESAIMKFVMPATSTTIEGLMARIDVLESTLIASIGAAGVQKTPQVPAQVLPVARQDDIQPPVAPEDARPVKTPQPPSEAPARDEMVSTIEVTASADDIESAKTPDDGQPEPETPTDKDPLDLEKMVDCMNDILRSKSSTPGGLLEGAPALLPVPDGDFDNEARVRFETPIPDDFAQEMKSSVESIASGFLVDAINNGRWSLGANNQDGRWDWCLVIDPEMDVMPEEVQMLNKGLQISMYVTDSPEEFDNMVVVPASNGA